MQDLWDIFVTVALVCFISTIMLIIVLTAKCEADDEPPPARPCYIFNDAPALELGDVYRGGPGCTQIENGVPYSIECEPEQLVCED